MAGLHPPTGAPGRAPDPTLTRLEGPAVAEATPVGEVSAPRPLSNGAWCHSKIRPLDGRIDPGRAAAGHAASVAPDEDAAPSERLTLSLLPLHGRANGLRPDSARWPVPLERQGAPNATQQPLSAALQQEEQQLRR